jgi:Protein of unknown function (DUF2958)
MKLLTKEVLAKLPKLGGQEGKGMQAMVHAKFFNPQGAGTWYATEFDGVDEFFGAVDLGMTDVPELGYFSLAELSGFRGRLGLGIERDRYWTPVTLGEVFSKGGR